MRSVTVSVAVFFAILVICYGSFWLAKNGSYFFWYEDLVKETVIEMVKKEALK
jgi:hypothetical protein